MEEVVLINVSILFGIISNTKKRKKIKILKGLNKLILAVI